MLELIVLAAIAAGVAGALQRRKLRKRRAEQLATDRAALAPQLDALASHIVGLADEIDVAPGARAEHARASYEAAIAAYGEVRDALPKVATHPAVEALRHKIADGVHAARTARATLDGEPAPPREVPLTLGLCAFDPAHGRADQRAEVTTPSGTPSVLPVCAECAAGLSGGHIPIPRVMSRNGTDVAYWNDPAFVGGANAWAGLFAAIDDIVKHQGTFDSGSVVVHRSRWVMRDGVIVHEEHAGPGHPRA